ncbi:DUF1573 domain-containing protein [Membranihabitans maritimus]|uniref:DUF1573 domain-containing protein n=1 Tax=Membranihabitans maritimus TaxID=2904244 RepID=UPI001F1B4818|nr:DUF1573 domain-containing protein [Membranihabitans maritimus]
MKHILLTLALFAAVFTFAEAQNSNLNDSEKNAVFDSEKEKPSLEFESKTIDYGEIEKGSDPYRTFKFKNVSNEPVVIKNAKGSCGCTVPETPKEPIMPGASSEIKVRYDTERIGTFAKTVTVNTSSDETIVLNIKGKVYKPEDKSVPKQDKTAF